MDANLYNSMHEKLQAQKAKTMFWMLMTLIALVFWVMAGWKLAKIELAEMKETLARIESQKCAAEAKLILEEMGYEEQRREQEEIRIFVENELGLDEELLKQLEKAQN